VKIFINLLTLVKLPAELIWNQTGHGNLQPVLFSRQYQNGGIFGTK
jgi:hypothetical protein